MTEKTKNWLFYAAVGVIILLGVVLRILFYSYARPFWNDESALALNIINRSITGLFTPLHYQQAAPVLFSVLCKFCDFLPAAKEYALRLPAFIFGLLSVPAFFILCCKVLKKNVSKIFALLLFCLNFQLVYYSQELKQYSADVFLFISVLLTYFYFDCEKSKKAALSALSVFLSLCIWFSYSAVFAVIIVLVLLFFKYKKRMLPFAVAPFCSIAALGLYTIRLQKDIYLHNFWADGFIAKDFSNFNTILNNNLVFFFPDFAGKFFVLLLFFAGLFYLLKSVIKKHDSQQSLLLLLPFVCAIALSYFSIYPMYLRTMLYLFPIAILVMAKSFDCFSFKNKILNYLLGGFIFLHFFVCTFKTDFNLIFLKNYYLESTPDLLKTFEQKSDKNDILIVPYLTKINYEMYKNTTTLDESRVLLVQSALYEPEEISKAFDTLQKGRTYYILFTHSGDKPAEYKNLCAYAKKQRNAEILSDKNLNALIRFDS